MCLFGVSCVTLFSLNFNHFHKDGETGDIKSFTKDKIGTQTCAKSRKLKPLSCEPGVQDIEESKRTGVKQHRDQSCPDEVDLGARKPSNFRLIEPEEKSRSVLVAARWLWKYVSRAICISCPLCAQACAGPPLMAGLDQSVDKWEEQPD
ncbi:hypothetical protein CEXT_503631 [Caerostris extrusa]|uniref:Uncharacterized protein n=1 Tax=Caerostris extrusa TaxID=172846 RepID=A0AAV4PDC6_CAEEX|nr:hypothetical protein CEXT_503631 [Caerostris extrusa]